MLISPERATVALTYQDVHPDPGDITRSGVDSLDRGGSQAPSFHYPLWMSCCDDDHCAGSEQPNSPRWRQALWIALGVNPPSSSRRSSRALPLAPQHCRRTRSTSLAMPPTTQSAWRGWDGAGMACPCRLCQGEYPDRLRPLGARKHHMARSAWHVAERRGDGSRWCRRAGREWRRRTLLYRFRTGDSNMRSVWICSRNDAIGNLAVMLAAMGVLGPDGLA